MKGIVGRSRFYEVEANLNWMHQLLPREVLAFHWVAVSPAVWPAGLSARLPKYRRGVWLDADVPSQ